VHAAHRRQVDDQAVVDDGRAGDVVPTAAHGQGQPVLRGEPDRAGDVFGVGAPRDYGRALVDHPVPHPAGGLVLRVIGRDDLAGQLLGERGGQMLWRGLDRRGMLGAFVHAGEARRGRSPRHRPYRPTGEDGRNRLDELGERERERRQREQARPSRVPDRRGPRRQAELRPHVRHVPVHGVRAEDQAIGDLGVAQPLGHESEDLALARSQLADSTRLSLARVDPCDVTRRAELRKGLAGGLRLGVGGVGTSERREGPCEREPG
jgi:hypothetical protein